MATKSQRIFDFFFAHTSYTSLEEPSRRLLFFAADFMQKKNIACEVYFLSDKKMADLNMRFKKKKGPATVLSFVADPQIPRPDFGKNITYIGEIYVAPDYIHNVKKDLLSRYLIHGFLHLSGLTHARSCDRIHMEALEEKIADAFFSGKRPSKNF